MINLHPDQITASLERTEKFGDQIHISHRDKASAMIRELRKYGINIILQRQILDLALSTVDFDELFQAILSNADHIKTIQDIRKHEAWVYRQSVALKALVSAGKMSKKRCDELIQEMLKGAK